MCIGIPMEVVGPRSRYELCRFRGGTGLALPRSSIGGPGDAGGQYP